MFYAGPDDDKWNNTYYIILAKVHWVNSCTSNIFLL